MKKIAIVLFTALVLTSCNSVTENVEVVNNDSTLVVVDTTNSPVLDTTSTPVVEVTVTPTSTVK